MFRAARDWFGSGRGRHIVRLFIFELTVVTLGVLIAQWVQGLAQDRGARAHMEDERARARLELQRVHLVAQDWITAVPCLDRRMTEIMSGAKVDGAALVRPTLINPGYTPPDEESMVLIDRLYGHREKAVLSGMAIGTVNIRNVVIKIVENWGKLALIDPANGPIGPSDRAEARSAAANIKAQLHSAAIISDDISVRLRGIGVGMSDDENPENGPARSCDAIWRSKRIDPPLAMR